MLSQLRLCRPLGVAGGDIDALLKWWCKAGVTRSQFIAMCDECTAYNWIAYQQISQEDSGVTASMWNLKIDQAEVDGWAVDPAEVDIFRPSVRS